MLYQNQSQIRSYKQDTEDEWIKCVNYIGLDKIL